MMRERGIVFTGVVFIVEGTKVLLIAHQSLKASRNGSFFIAKTYINTKKTTD